MVETAKNAPTRLISAVVRIQGKILTGLVENVLSVTNLAFYVAVKKNNLRFSGLMDPV